MTGGWQPQAESAPQEPRSGCPGHRGRNRTLGSHRTPAHLSATARRGPPRRRPPRRAAHRALTGATRLPALQPEVHAPPCRRAGRAEAYTSWRSQTGHSVSDALLVSVVRASSGGWAGQATTAAGGGNPRERAAEPKSVGDGTRLPPHGARGNAPPDKYRPDHRYICTLFKLIGLLFAGGYELQLVRSDFTATAASRSVDGRCAVR